MMNPAPKAPDESTYSGRFAARLRKLREKTGMTGQEMAKAIVAEGYKVTGTTYYRWEAGQSEPSFNVLPVLAKILGISPRSLMPKE